MTAFAMDQQEVESLRLAIQLQNEDLDQLTHNVKGKGRENDTNDLSLALFDFRTELANAARCLSDLSFSQSLSQAIHSDHSIIYRELLQEEQARRDRTLAENLSCTGHGVTANQDFTAERRPVLDLETLAKLSVRYASVDEGTHLYEQSLDGFDVQNAETSMRRNAKSKTNVIKCLCCMEELEFWQLARLPCRHQYCRGCLNDLFQASVKDETLFPPRCCTLRIPLDEVRLYLAERTVREYESKAPELSAPNRTYCSQRECSAWVAPEHIEADVATCAFCHHETCTICKQPRHSGDCPADTLLQDLLAEAQSNQWQRCYRCRTLVELNYGCNHITCRCGAQFCYLCGHQWKTCSCDQWTEERLYRRAQQIFDRGQPVPLIEHDVVPEQTLPGPEELPRTVIPEVRGLMNDLRNNHECPHDRWGTIHGRHRCEECHDTLPNYIFQCQQCHIQACRRCRHNRL